MAGDVMTSMTDPGQELVQRFVDLRTQLNLGHDSAAVAIAVRQVAAVIALQGRIATISTLDGSPSIPVQAWQWSPYEPAPGYGWHTSSYEQSATGIFTPDSFILSPYQDTLRLAMPKRFGRAQKRIAALAINAQGRPLVKIVIED